MNLSKPCRRNGGSPLYSCFRLLSVPLSTLDICRISCSVTICQFSNIHCFSCCSIAFDNYQTSCAYCSIGTGQKQEIETSLKPLKADKIRKTRGQQSPCPEFRNSRRPLRKFLNGKGSRRYSRCLDLYPLLKHDCLLGMSYYRRFNTVSPSVLPSFAGSSNGVISSSTGIKSNSP